MPAPISMDASHIDLTPRYAFTTTVAASPAAGAITTIATLAALGDVAVLAGIKLTGWAAFTVGTNGVTMKLDIRRTNSAGTVVATTGAVTCVAATLVTISAHGVDTGIAAANQVYVLCLTIGSGSAASTVSAVALDCLVV